MIFKRLFLYTTNPHITLEKGKCTEYRIVYGKSNLNLHKITHNLGDIFKHGKSNTQKFEV